MALKCDNCGKGVMYGHAVSHAKNRTRRLFKPNLHAVRIVEDGRSSRVRLCTKCLRMIKKKLQAKIVKPQASVATVVTV
jgi:large subunit ribosomal protein L28